MRTAIQRTQLIKRFLELAQPLPVTAAYTKGITTGQSIITYQHNGSSSFTQGVGNTLIAERAEYIITVQTQTAKENMIYSELIKLATQFSVVEFISESRAYAASTKNCWLNQMILNVYSSIPAPQPPQQILEGIADNYTTTAASYGISFTPELPPLDDLEEALILEIKRQYLDDLLTQAIAEQPDEPKTYIQGAELIRRTLELSQPLDVLYGYPRGMQQAEAFITYQDIGTVQTVKGIGNQLIGERLAYLIVVQTNTQLQNMFYSELVKMAANGTHMLLLSESLRFDGRAKGCWKNYILVNLYNTLHPNKLIYTAQEARLELQRIADRYIFTTSIYAQSLSDSFLDRLIVPPLEDRLYSYEEVLILKQQHLDKLLLQTTNY